MLQVLVFDFGSEMYLWTGKQVPFAQRKVGLRLVQELWDKGYDYTDSEVNPFSPLQSEWPLHCDPCIDLIYVAVLYGLNVTAVVSMSIDL